MHPIYTDNGKVKIEVKTDILTDCTLTVTQGETTSEFQPPGPATAFQWWVADLEPGNVTVSASVMNSLGSESVSTTVLVQ